MTEPRRSTATKAAILAAARVRFAADGYERATIRAIAADAGIDPAMVMRYYGNKEKLFAAAADFDLKLPDLTWRPVGQAAAAMVRHFLGQWEASETFVALLRSAVSNEFARDRMHSVFATQVAPLVRTVCPVPAEAETRAALIATQLLGLALCRYVLQLPPIAQMPADDVVAWLSPTLHRYLTADGPI